MFKMQSCTRNLSPKPQMLGSAALFGKPWPNLNREHCTERELSAAVVTTVACLIPYACARLALFFSFSGTLRIVAATVAAALVAGLYVHSALSWRVKRLMVPCKTNSNQDACRAKLCTASSINTYTITVHLVLVALTMSMLLLINTKLSILDMSVSPKPCTKYSTTNICSTHFDATHSHGLV